MDANDDSIESIYEHVFGAAAPSQMLFQQGKFPENWVDRYLKPLEVATREWQDQPMWPCRLVAAIHFASWYLNLRYDVWRTNATNRNENTERDLASIRTPSELFLMRALVQSKRDQI